MKLDCKQRVTTLFLPWTGKKLSSSPEKPDLIISDVMMPRISGFEMLDILRNTDGLKDVRVIMLTALGQAEDKTRADSLGADRYLVKSQVTLEDIVKAAQELLGPSSGTAAPQAASAAAPTAPVATNPAPPEPTVPVISPPPPATAATTPVAPDQQPPAGVPMPTNPPPPPTPVSTPPAPEPPVPPQQQSPVTAPPAIPSEPPALPPEPVSEPSSTPPPVFPPEPPEPPSPKPPTVAETAPPIPAPAEDTPSAEVVSSPEAAPPAPEPTSPSDQSREAQSVSAEEETIKAQIESFVNQNNQTAPGAAEDTTPTPQENVEKKEETPAVSDDALMVNAIKDLASNEEDASTEDKGKVITPPEGRTTMPAPDVVSPAPV
ncbi:MAG: response regulator, partial [Patescibacteria group bacterium]